VFVKLLFKIIISIQPK